MSRIWKLPINIPEWVEVDIKDNSVFVKWPKWTLQRDFEDAVKIDKDENTINVSIDNEDNKNLWWLVRSLINNMVIGVNSWFEKRLLVLGVGYSASVQWQTVVFNLWYSHPIQFQLPEWVSANTEKDPKWNIVLVLSWIDKQLVGQVAANVRELRPPEPYKWKWIRYADEYVKMKVWKTAKK